MLMRLYQGPAFAKQPMLVSNARAPCQVQSQKADAWDGRRKAWSKYLQGARVLVLLRPIGHTIAAF
jgi:hypothetical protein